MDKSGHEVVTNGQKWSRVVINWSLMVKSGHGEGVIWAWWGGFMVDSGAGGGEQGYSWGLGGGVP